MPEPLPERGRVRFQPASDQSLLICFGDSITPEANTAVFRLLRMLSLRPAPGLLDFHPAYCSLLINFDARKLRHADVEAILRGYLNRLDAAPLSASRLIEIPVCYGGEFGPDLPELAALHHLTPERAIELHASVTYRVYFLGFVPGFAYLSELPRELTTPRLAAPRKRVPEGSVGIAGTQTGVYPFATPGGWRLIGRTPLAMFRTDRAPRGPDNVGEMSLLAIGDRVRFVPISPERFAELAAL